VAVSTPTVLQSTFNDVPSVVILTEKERYLQGEKIPITIKNVGSIPVVFSDSNYGIFISSGQKKNLDFEREMVKTVFHPNEEHTIIQDNEPTAFNVVRYSITTSYSLLDSEMKYEITS